ncbi:MAG: ABC transporter ATP-binding protein [Fusobacteriaceae bacterium]|jgi:lipoprotein-releasing system ATP-binding protein|nr:ABC transporter ATP-binding protein [Fusobacteriaceae bacterium]
MSELLCLESIRKNYRTKTDELHILRDLDFSVEAGEFAAVLGRSGSGKSTLLNIMGLLDKPDGGKIYFEGKEITERREKEIDSLKNQFLGFVFQFNHLLPEFTALENVLLPALASPKTKRGDALDRAQFLLTRMELGDRLQHKPNQLSGGEKQRVAIARALMNNPKILLADEPTGNLDEETSETIFKLFLDLNRELGQTLVVVTHSRDLARLADRRYSLKKGILTTETD